MTERTAQLAHNWIKDADALLITASNVFSISEGLNLFANDQEKLKEVLGDLVDKYHLPNLITAFQFPYKDQLDHWRVIARAVEYYDYHYRPTSLMTDLKEIIGDKPYFIWTSNGEHHFSIVGFKNVFEIEGNWLEFICSKHSAKHGVHNIAAKLHEFYEKDAAGTLTEADIPRCDTCGAELEMNIAGEDFQVNQTQLTNLQKFLETYEDQKLTVLELGIGPQNQLIKMPSMQLVAADPKSYYITVNKGQLYIPDQIKDHSIGFSSSITSAFKEIISGQSFGATTVGPEKVKPVKPLTDKERQEQEKAMQKFYPNYMVDQGSRPGSFPMYMTIDQEHLSHLHAVQYGRSFMWDMGDSAIVHCFTQSGQYYQVRLGLDKMKDEVHGFYVDPGTFIAIENADDTGTGFSQINTEIPTNASSEILVPRKDVLLRLFPDQRQIIKRFATE